MNRSMLRAVWASGAALVAVGVFVAVSAAANAPHAARQLGLYTSGQRQYVPPSSAVAPPTPLSADVCGTWSASSSSTGQAIRKKYGAVIYCGLVGDNWVVAAYGNRPNNGAIGVFHCASTASACLNGANAHPIGGWRFFTPPYKGNVTELMVLNASSIIVDNAGHQLCFSLSTDQYTCPSA